MDAEATAFLGALTVQLLQEALGGFDPLSDCLRSSEHDNHLKY